MPVQELTFAHQEGVRLNEEGALVLTLDAARALHISLSEFFNPPKKTVYRLGGDTSEVNLLRGG